MSAERASEKKQLNTEVFGRDVSFAYSETWVGYSLVGLRLVMTCIFLTAGFGKWAEDGWSDPLAWSSANFLENAVADANPLHGLFMWFAEYTAVVDSLVIFGQVLIGLALLLGVVLRFAALMGGLQMLLFWTAAWEGGVLAGLPVENGYVFDSSFVYLLLLFALGAWGAGRILGVDAKLEETQFVQNNLWLKYLLG